MKKKSALLGLLFIIFLGIITLNFFSIDELKLYISHSPFAKLYVYLRDGKDYDQDHVLTKLDNGMHIVVNKYDRCVCWSIRLTGHWDSNETRVLKQIVKNGFHVIEVGSNFGAHTLRMSELVGEKGKIFAFEANPNVSKYLKKSIEINHLTNILLFEKAAGDAPGDANLIFSLLNIGDGHLVHENKSGAVKTKIVKLDDSILEPHIDLLKIDAEGYEYKIFNGAKNIIEKNANHIILMFEWVHAHLKKQHTSPESIIDFLKHHNFKLWRVGIRSKGEPILISISYDELLSLPVGDILASKINLDKN